MADISKPSTEEAANLFDQVTFSDSTFISQNTACESESEQPASKLPAVKIKATKKTASPPQAKIDGFSILLDHLRSEAIQNNNRSKARPDEIRYAA